MPKENSGKFSHDFPIGKFTHVAGLFVEMPSLSRQGRISLLWPRVRETVALGSIFFYCRLTFGKLLLAFCRVSTATSRQTSLPVRGLHPSVARHKQGARLRTFILRLLTIHNYERYSSRSRRTAFTILKRIKERDKFWTRERVGTSEYCVRATEATQCEETKKRCKNSNELPFVRRHEKNGRRKN